LKPTAYRKRIAVGDVTIILTFLIHAVFLNLITSMMSKGQSKSAPKSKQIFHEFWRKTGRMPVPQIFIQITGQKTGRMPVPQIFIQITGRKTGRILGVAVSVACAKERK